MGKTLILGFYNRNNAGDDCYVYAFKKLFGSNASLEFHCMDDIDSIPPDTNMVICGGGDIINQYFMEKARSLLANFPGVVYAISVGIPYPSCSRYLQLFDHVFTRSNRDYQISCNEIGSENTTLIPDLAWYLYDPPPVPLPLTNKLRIGVFLAQPLFNCSNRTNLMQQLFNAFFNVTQSVAREIEWHLISFNSFTTNTQECDHYINYSFSDLMSTKIERVYFHESIVKPNDIYNFIKNNIHVSVCMRYHSLVFSAIAKKQIVAINCSSKIKSLSEDLSIPIIDIENLENLTGCIIESINDYQNLVPKYPSSSCAIIKSIMDLKKTRRLLVKPPPKPATDICLECKLRLSDFPSNDPYDRARFICYLITGNSDHQCMWGLAQNMQSVNFDIDDAIHYIYNEYYKDSSSTEEHYLPFFPQLERKQFIILDRYFTHDFSQYHRSGWAYAINGMQNINCNNYLRESNLMVDTYLDKSFHWGYETLKAIGAVPYTTPWIGFIHHTFDSTHTNYNTRELFANPDFRLSLANCKGLIVLSNYLKRQVEQYMKDNLSQYTNIKVSTLYHPMEFVTKTFTMAAFEKNPNKSIVQIGAWMRNPYCIYELNAPTLRKCALKGKEMDLYFPPVDLEERLNVFSENNSSPGDTYVDQNTICRPVVTHNKFCHGAADHIRNQINSVTVLSRLTNSEYDDLLANNIVFINLVDCSAVNTVIECIVRNTPIIINRHPALEEVLSSNYPGFYDTIEQASMLSQSMVSISLMHEHILRLDKRRYQLQHFVEEFQKIVSNDGHIEVYNEFAAPTMMVYLLNNFNSIKRFLPQKFQM